MKKSYFKNSLITEYILPDRIVAQKGCNNSDVIFTERARQVELFAEKRSLEIEKGGYIILDFGAEIQGGVMITLTDVPDNSHLRIVFGESVSEAMSSIGEKNATNNHAIRDMVWPVTCYQTFRAGNTGFRFVKIEAVDGTVKFGGIQGAFDHRDIIRKGEFECSDRLVNKIWDVGAYTVFLNMQEYLWDGIKRDRLVWVGDMHPELMTILSAYGDNEVIRKSLDFISGYTGSNEWMNTISSYNFWWLKIQLDYYIWSGDIEYLKSHKTYIIEMTEHILSCINTDGTHNIDHIFTEWNSHDTPWEEAGFQAVLAMGIESAAKLLRILSENALAERCEKVVVAVKQHVYLYKGDKQVSAMLSLTDMVDSEKISNEVLKPSGGKGLSTFWGYYTLLALSKSGDVGDAINIIKEFWGKMIELGATTFWESFRLEWAENAAGIDAPVPEGKKDIHGDFGEFCYQGFRHSLCHGWASGPTSFLSRAVLGINIIEAGCKRVEINPQLGNLEWAKGKFPTPFGEICVEHTKKDGKIITKCIAPKEIEIIYK